MKYKKKILNYPHFICIGPPKSASTWVSDHLKFNKDISAMKIDVEGYDLDVLKGAEKTILKHKMPIIFECNNDEKDHYPKIKDFEEFLKK